MTRISADSPSGWKTIIFCGLAFFVIVLPLLVGASYEDPQVDMFVFLFGGIFLAIAFAKEVRMWLMKYSTAATFFWSESGIKKSVYRFGISRR